MTGDMYQPTHYLYISDLLIFVSAFCLFRSHYITYSLCYFYRFTVRRSRPTIPRDLPRGATDIFKAKDTTMQSTDGAIPQSAPIEKPQNGIAGLKHWRSDMLAGLLVSLVSLPFSLGIAIASGAPPVAGLISAIIAGLIYSFLGGSFVTIIGPAVGLVSGLLFAMAALVRGDREVVGR